MSEPIRGGYYLKARSIENSDIAHMPPHVREIWDYLLRKAFWQDGKQLKRGELLTSYKEIREALHWKIGWRKETYSKSHCENSMKALKRAGMITTRKATRGLVVCICNYCRFQDPDSYESHSDRHKERRNETRRSATPIDEEENKKEELKESTPAPGGFPCKDFERFQAVNPGCERVWDFEFAQCLRSYPGADVSEAVEAFERQLAGAGRLQFPIREFEKYLRRSVGKKDGSRGFPQKNAAQDLADQKAIRERLLERPAGEESQAERLKRQAVEREQKRRQAAEEESEG